MTCVSIPTQQHTVAAQVFGYHELFHLLVTVAASLHFAAVYLLLLRAEA